MTPKNCRFLKSFWLYTLLTILLVSSFGSVTTTTAQNRDGQKYIIANQLFRQGNYEEAYSMFKELLQKNPDSRRIFEKTTDCLMQLKRYDEAISLTKKRIDDGFQPVFSHTRLGELYHVSGDTAKAFDTWDKALTYRTGNIQTYLTVARTMKERGVYDRAIEVYRKARNAFNNPTLFNNEVANTYLMAGRYEDAIGEYLDTILDHPERMDYIQRSLLRYDDSYLFEVATLEIEDLLGSLSANHKAYDSLNQLLLWLLMEQQLYRRALSTAIDFESQSNSMSFSLYRLADRLRSARKYELALKAYKHYIDEKEHPLTDRSLHEMAITYRKWADYLSRYNLVSYQKRDSIYTKSLATYQELVKQRNDYPKISEVYQEMSELTLDHLNSLEKAQNYFAEFKRLAPDKMEPQVHYIEGRIHLFQDDFARARISFTRSNKQTRIGDLAEKTRYYLGLSDFYGGDYEFAKLQLKALEKQNTSYYANDAVKLRSWIQTGLQADSTGTQLDAFANAHLLFNKGKLEDGFEAMDTLLAPNSYSDLKPHAILLLSSESAPVYPTAVYRTINKYVQSGMSSPLRERLLWERAEIGYRTYKNPEMLEDDQTVELMNTVAAADIAQEAKAIPSQPKEIRKLYEQILLEYPSGFYSSFARDRLQEISNKYSS